MNTPASPSTPDLCEPIPMPSEALDSALSCELTSDELQGVAGGPIWVEQ